MSRNSKNRRDAKKHKMHASLNKPEKETVMGKTKRTHPARADKITAHIIDDATFPPEAEAKLRAIFTVASDIKMRPALYQITHHNKKIFACIAGGQLVNDEPYLTPTGMATTAALGNLPLSFPKVHMLELRKRAANKEPVPLSSLLDALLGAFDNYSAVAFFGDMAGYLDAAWADAISIKGHITIDQILAERTDPVLNVDVARKVENEQDLMGMTQTGRDGCQDKSTPIPSAPAFSDEREMP